MEQVRYKKINHYKISRVGLNFPFVSIRYCLWTVCGQNSHFIEMPSYPQTILRLSTAKSTVKPAVKSAAQDVQQGIEITVDCRIGSA